MLKAVPNIEIRLYIGILNSTMAIWLDILTWLEIIDTDLWTLRGFYVGRR
jgi:hypothetical protein